MSLALSGNNTQSCFVQYRESFQCKIGNNKSKWLLDVHPKQWETILSVRTYLQNLE